ncbi:hypothetical protein K1719_036468 [Acacia pycnantha]|nr:hypothetical protein K1719_036468 [Acacia pycnantha]
MEVLVSTKEKPLKKAKIEDLHSLALIFKLLRQHGYPLSPDSFNKFKDEKGNFKETLTSDVEGMITLYDACHLSIRGEDILDEALAFTSNHLRTITIESNPFLAAKLKNVLNQCPYREIPRLGARKYISIYYLRPSHNQVLLTLAILDFNAIQKNSSERVWHYLQLEIFTKAIERWDMSCLDDLPEYLKPVYKELLIVFEQTDQEMRKEGRSYSVDYTKNEL